MAGNNHFQTLKDLEGYTFVIPSQQRGYKWSKENILALLSDLQGFYSKNANLFVFFSSFAPTSG